MCISICERAKMCRGNGAQIAALSSHHQKQFLCSRCYWVQRPNSGNLFERKSKFCKNQREFMTPGEHFRWDHRKWTSTHGHAGISMRPSVYLLWLLAWCFCGTPNWEWVCLLVICLLLRLFTPFGLLSSSWIWVLLFFLLFFYLVLLCLIGVSSMSAPFWRKTKGNFFWGKGWWGAQGGVERKGNCIWDTLYERGIYLK